MKSKSSDRFRKIIKVFVNYGFGYIFDSKNIDDKKSPENLRKAFEELGATFIKIGQILSTRPDLLPKKYIDELIKLQDSVPEDDFNESKLVFQESFNDPIEKFFKYIKNYYGRI